MNRQQRLVIVVAILASAVAFLDGVVVNVALPVIQHELGGGLAAQQWIVDGYLLTLSAFMLVAGSLSDVFGRLKIFRYGLIGFGISSLFCAFAPNAAILILARLLQGIAGALLVPSSLALIDDRVPERSFSKAIGQWTAWTGMAFLVGPLLGGFFVDQLSWRYIFAINVIPIFLTLWLMRQLRADAAHKVDESRIDLIGALLCTLALGGIVFAFIEVARLGWRSPLIWSALVIGSGSLVGFIRREQKCPYPMLPPELFKYRNFTAGNLATFAIYGALGAITFIVVLFLQQVTGYSATASGLSLVPITLIMFLGSPWAGSLSQRFGPRFFMAGGPMVIAAGLVWLAMAAAPQIHYVKDILPGVILFGIGLTLTVTPLTATVLGGVAHNKAGVASAVNNAISRIAGLIAVAGIGIVLASQFNASLVAKQAEAPTATAKQALQASEDQVLQVTPDTKVTEADSQFVTNALTDASISSYRTSVLITAVIVALGGVISLIGIHNPQRPIKP